MIFRNLLRIIEAGDYESLRENGNEIADYIEYEMRHQGKQEYNEKNFLTYHLAAHEDHVKGSHMFQAFKRACSESSPYYWSEIMAMFGHSLMCGAVDSQNIKILEHAMCHVDENLLFDRILLDDDESPVSKWYDENFT